ncbi:MAG TPA: hypothetical protein VGX28_01905 [Frankiaceae bacterium]|jgi:hypothetical protein|nr:hypothetical protein [Frankiaceae bacterium]
MRKLLLLGGVAASVALTMAPQAASATHACSPLIREFPAVCEAPHTIQNALCYKFC